MFASAASSRPTPSPQVRGEAAPPAKIVCFPFTGDVLGGSHISALGLIRRLDPRRFTPLVVLHEMDGPVAHLFRDAQIAVEPAPVTFRLKRGQRVRAQDAVRYVAELPAMIRFLTERRVTIVHSNDGRSHATWALPARLSGAKLVWHHRGSPDAWSLRWLAPLLANRLVTVSKFAAPRSGRLGRPGSYEVVHSPFVVDCIEDRCRCRAELIEELGCPPETRLVGYFGTLIARKRPFLFVEAIAEMQRQAPKIPVIGLLFGDPLDIPLAAVRDNAETRGIADFIRLMGFRKPGTRWIAACDVLMVPAVDEPFGRTLIEAMLVGTPVVATASGGNAEALLDGAIGLLTPPDDPEALARATLRLLSDPELYQSIATRARLDARSRFGDDRHASAISRIYDGLLRSA
jgi:glycosyltransferase involved in cell wall biosynthesis